MLKRRLSIFPFPFRFPTEFRRRGVCRQWRDGGQTLPQSDRIGGIKIGRSDTSSRLQPVRQGVRHAVEAAASRFISQRNSALPLSAVRPSLFSGGQPEDTHPKHSPRRRPERHSRHVRCRPSRH